MKDPQHYNVFKDLKNAFEECGLPICGESELLGNYLEIRCARHWPRRGYADAICIIYHLIRQKIIIRISYEPFDHSLSVKEEELVEILNRLPEALRNLLITSKIIHPAIELRERELLLIDHHFDKAEFKKLFKEALGDVQKCFPLVRKQWKQKFEIKRGKQNTNANRG